MNNMGYSLSDYGLMIADGKRMEPHQQALRQVIKPGMVVVDLGTGIGIMTFLACQMGAGRVYAIERSNAIQIAIEQAAVNGFSGRIEFIHALSTNVILPERAGVIISDLRGPLPFNERALLSIIDARQRFLAPGGVLIPHKDILWAALVESADLYQKVTAAWGKHDYGLNWSTAKKIAVNGWQKVRIEPEQLLSAPQKWFDLDYETVESPHARGEITYRMTRKGTAHGVVVWFDTILAPGMGFTNAPGAPGAPEFNYGNAFFPWQEPVDLAIGDKVMVSLEARLLGNNYLWRWDTRIIDQGLPGRLKADFRQSTFFGSTLTRAELRQMAADHVPTLTKDGQIDRFIIEMVDGKTSLGDIARRLVKKFPHRFVSEKEAQTRASELSLKYGHPLDRKYLREP
jgi:protein arginine N-methyltransferase 1